MSFWKNVDNELQYKNMSRKELASKVGFAVSGISLGITNNSYPSADVAYKIAKELDVSVEYLISGSESAQQSAEMPIELKRLINDVKKLDNYDLITLSYLVKRFLDKKNFLEKEVLHFPQIKAFNVECVSKWLFNCDFVLKDFYLCSHIYFLKY